MTNLKTNGIMLSEHSKSRKYILSRKNMTRKNIS